VPIRIVYLGTPLFAVPALERLAGEPDFEIPLVISQPDRPAGRGKALTEPPIKQAALRLGLPLLQPGSMRDEGALAALADARPDVLIVVAYGELLHRPVLEAAPHGALNVHPSLLPRYRGAAPIPAAILNGDRVTGTSVIKLVRRMDAGPILAQQPLDITANETTESLSRRLARQAASMLPEVMRAWVYDRIAPTEQDESQASYTREWTKEDARIDWSAPADAIERLVRAAYPWPVAWTTLGASTLRVEAVRLVDASESTIDAPGTVRAHGRRVLVQTGTARLELVRVQPAGKRVMTADEWWRGQRREAAHLGS
jgi:methionyl-tRNA formyltransferase